MMRAEQLNQRFQPVFTDPQAKVLSETISESYQELVKTSDFTELKDIVSQLGKAQNRTEKKVEELADAQKRTEKKVEELVDAQKRTEEKVGELVTVQKETTLEIKSLTQSLKENNNRLGGLSNSIGYALENEAYRMLPNFLRKHYDINLKEKLIRTEVGNKEINFLGKMVRNKEKGIVVGECKLRLDVRRKNEKKGNVFDEMYDKIYTVQKEYPGMEIFPFIVTHYATKKSLSLAEKEGIVVIQSFEW